MAATSPRWRSSRRRAPSAWSATRRWTTSGCASRPTSSTAVRVVGYAAVDDVGRLAHPVIVEGQIHGGVAQGLGQVLGEQVVYGETGQLLTASFMDYMLPRAADLPDLRVGHHVVPCTTNPLGVKGAGESGVAGSLPSAVNAVVGALASRGGTHPDLPVTPARRRGAPRTGPSARLHPR